MRHDTNTLDGAKPPKLPFEVALVSIVAETGDNESLESVATNIGVLVWFDYQHGVSNAITNSTILLLLPEILTFLRPLDRQPRGRLSLLSLLPIAHLQPALGGLVHVRLLVLLQLGQKSGDASDGGCPALLGRMVRGFYPSQRRSRGEERQQVRGELVRHGEGSDEAPDAAVSRIWGR